jgi:hypothetical protein
MRFLSCATLLLGLGLSAAAPAADDYWGYTYRNIDITASGTNAYAVNVARYCVRLDSLLTQILSIRASDRLPTHIYALPAGQMKLYTAGDYSSVYRSSGYDTTVILDSSEVSNGRHYWGAYFGYTATLLSSDRLLGGPDWYMVGVPSVFADVVFEGVKVKIGNVTPGFANTLVTGGALIPMRTFLGLRQRDAEAKGKHFLDMYDAEAWYLAREVFVERLHRAEFGKYLDLMRQGKDEAAAFAASFAISYEDLDRELVQAMHERAHVYIMDSPDDPSAGGAVATRLDATEVKARLALLSVRYQQGPDALQLGREVLQKAPANETALRALALAQLAKGDYAEALTAVDQLLAQGASDAARADCAYVLDGLARAAAQGDAHLDAAALRQRAVAEYRRVLSSGGTDRRSRDGLARLEHSL